MRALVRLAPERQMPILCAQFPRLGQEKIMSRCWETGRGNQANVVLWLDTFNNYFQPQTSRAALEVLQQAGFNVAIPNGHLCCGRPLYDFGMLDRAKRYLQNVMQSLRPQLMAGLPIVVLEPSCASVFRDELYGLFPNDPLAQRLRSQTFLLSEFWSGRPRIIVRLSCRAKCSFTGIVIKNQ